MATSLPLSISQEKEDKSFLKNILLFQVSGIVLGYGIIPSILIIAGLAIVIGFMILRLSQKRLSESILMFLILQFLQPYLRTYAKGLPYFFVELNTIVFVLLYLREYATQTITELRTILTIIILYFVIEVVSYTEYSTWLPYKGIIGNSLALTLLMYAAVKKTKVSIPLENIIRSILLGGALLSGIILTAHLRGNIEYGSESNFEASNGMGPVQLSFYLALTSFLFFYKFFNENTAFKKIFYILQMLLIAGLSALTFSRGGLYFLASYSAFYIFFNTHKFSKSNNSVYVILVMIPMLIFAYNAVLDISDNKFTDRINEKGTGNRDALVDYGIQIFNENPAIGVGTSGYNEYVSQARFHGEKTGAHNEFVRSLSEHGILGGVLYFGFVISCFLGISQRRLSLSEKSIYYIFMFSYVAGTIHNGQKIGLQCFMVFLALSPLTNSSFKSNSNLGLKPKPFKSNSKIVPQT